MDSFENTFEFNFEALVSSKLDDFRDTSVPCNEDRDLGISSYCVIA